MLPREFAAERLQIAPRESRAPDPQRPAIHRRLTSPELRPAFEQALFDRGIDERCDIRLDRRWRAHSRGDPVRERRDRLRPVLQILPDRRRGVLQLEVAPGASVEDDDAIAKRPRNNRLGNSNGGIAVQGSDSCDAGAGGVEPRDLVRMPLLRPPQLIESPPPIGVEGCP